MLKKNEYRDDKADILISVTRKGVCGRYKKLY